MRCRVTILAILTSSLLGVVAVLVSNSEEGPRYNGRPLSHWVLLADCEDKEALAVLKHFDPRDIRYLIRWIQYQPASWRSPLYWRIMKLRPPSIFEPLAVWIGRPQREDLARGALATFLLLETNAVSAIPALVKLMNNAAAAPDTSERAARALGATGVDALPALVEATRDLTNPARFHAASAAFGIMNRPGTIVDVEFTNKLKDSWAWPWFTPNLAQ